MQEMQTQLGGLTDIWAWWWCSLQLDDFAGLDSTASYVRINRIAPL